MKLAILALALALPASGPVSAQPGPARTITPPSPPPQNMPNAFSEGGADCPSIRRQVEERRERVRPREDARPLGDEPTAFGFLAVDRRIDGCRRVTFLNGRSPRR